MSWITRRIAGFITFTVVAALLGSYAAMRGWLVGGLSLATTTGVVILAVAFLVSLGVTTSMKRQDQEQRAWADNQQAWQEYYARLYPGYYRRP